MRRLLGIVFLGCVSVSAQEPKALPQADERYKADILVVVAHPDDEGGVTPYLARAIYDEHKRVVQRLQGTLRIRRAERLTASERLGGCPRLAS